MDQKSKHCLMRWIVLTGCILSLPLANTAQTFSPAKLDSLFNLIEDNNRGMGSISLFYGGEEIYQRAYGFANADRKIKAGSKTKYRIGSISKTFTATIIMQLVEEGALRLDDSLSLFFPKIPNAGKITIEHMLRHRSGLHNFTDDEDYLSYLESPKTHKEMIDLITAKGTDFQPDARAEYSNTNYVLLTYIAEKLENKPMEEIMAERIFIKCNMINSYFGVNTEKPVAEALSYTRIGKWEASTNTNLSIPSGAGAVVATPHDLNRFYHALFSGKLVTNASLALMQKTIDGYGIGMFPIPFYDKKAFGHTGGIDAFHSMAAYFNDDKLSVSICSNGEVMGINDIMLGVLSIYFGMPYALPAFSPAIELNEEQLKLYTGVYSSETFPLKITITSADKTLIAQATGQSSFPLEAFEKDKFKFDPAKLTIEFVPSEKKLILLQGGGMFELYRE